MQHTAPKQTKLLGATVRGLGVIVAVECNLHAYSYALVEGDVSQRVLIRDLSRDELSFPVVPADYVKHVARVDVNTWDEVYSLVLAEALSFKVAA